MKIGIIIADDVEFRPFEEKAKDLSGYKEFSLAGCPALSFNYGNHYVIAIYCGVGKVNAASGVTALILNGVDAVISAGLSGAVSGVRRNTFVIGERYLQADVDMTAIGYELFSLPYQDKVTVGDDRLISACLKAIPNAVRGMIGSADFFLADTEKKSFFRNMGINVFDMESAANAAICAKNGVPYVAVRLISDDAGDLAAETYAGSIEYLEKQELNDAVFSCLEQL